MKRAMRLLACLSLAAATACATVETTSPEARSAIDQAYARCTMSVVGGALLGALVGNNVGDGNAGRGALIGAGAGGVACAVIMAAAREKAALIEGQRMAVSSGVGGNWTMTGSDGREISMDTLVEEAPPLAVADAVESERKCRMVSASAGDASSGAKRFCETPDGGWEVVETATRRCRTAKSTVAIAGLGATPLGGQRFCLSSGGEWEVA